MSGLVLCNLLFHPLVAGDGVHARDHAIRHDIAIIRNALFIHAQGERRPKVEAFDSSRLPEWWGNSPMRHDLLPDVEYSVSHQYVGKPIESVIDKPDFIAARRLPRTAVVADAR